jgi:nucleoside-diphosphate-sugar epimerase
VNDYNLLVGSEIDISTNVIGTHALLEACRTLNPWARIVYVSTFFVVGDPPSLPANEETVCRPKGLYGASKLCAEHMCRIYADTFDLNISIARGTNVYGPGQRVSSQKTAAFNWMIKTCVEGGIVPLYDGGAVARDYLYVDDAVSAIHTVAELGKKGETYFFGSGVSETFANMVAMIQVVSGNGSTMSVPSPGFHERVGIEDFWVDISKMKSLGWEPTVSLAEGIMRTVNWYRNEE